MFEWGSGEGGERSCTALTAGSPADTEHSAPRSLLPAPRRGTNGPPRRREFNGL